MDFYINEVLKIVVPFGPASVDAGFIFKSKLYYVEITP